MGAPVLNPTDLAMIAIMDKTLLSDAERALLQSWRRQTSDAHVLARIDFLLAP